jgi:hypothetical protein
VERTLGGIERQFYEHDRFGSVQGSLVLFLQGTARWDLLGAALESLARYCPPLLTCIRATPEPHIARLDPATKIPYRIQESSSPDAWRSVAEQLAPQRFDDQGPCIRVTVVAGSGRSELLVTVDHRLVDAVTALHLCQVLVSLLAGAPAPSSAMRLGPPLEELFPAARRGLRGGLALAADVMRLLYRGRKPALRLPLLHPEFTRTTSTRGLEVDATLKREMEGDAKAQGANLVALLSAVLLHATHHAFGDRKSHIIANLPVNIRPYLSPPVSLDTFGLYLAGLVEAVEVTDTKPILDTAKEMKRSISADLERRLPLGMARLFRAGSQGLRLDPGEDRLRPTLNISHLRGIDGFATLPEGRFSHYRAVGSLWPTDSLMVVCAHHQEGVHLDVHASQERLGEAAAARFTDILQAMLTGRAWVTRS